jgi:hypothetical protein
MGGGQPAVLRITSEPARFALWRLATTSASRRGEMLAHLRQLKVTGRVQRETRDGVWWWGAVSGGAVLRRTPECWQMVHAEARRRGGE